MRFPLAVPEKKGSDRGIDGLITFTGRDGNLERVLVSVKSGTVNSGMVRDLKGTIEREKAAFGLFITLEEPSKEMQLEADTAGLYRPTCGSGTIQNPDHDDQRASGVQETGPSAIRNADLPAG